MARTDDRKSIRCSFCGKTQNQAGRLIAGNGAYICDECIQLCMSIIADDVDEPMKEADAGKPKLDLNKLLIPVAAVAAVNVLISLICSLDSSLASTTLSTPCSLKNNTDS